MLYVKVITHKHAYVINTTFINTIIDQNKHYNPIKYL